MNIAKEWHGRCHRCGAKSTTYIMSMFDTSLVCFHCQEAEQRHPDYERARTAELEALRRGDRNFQGIGWTPSYPMTDLGNDPVDW